MSDVPKNTPAKVKRLLGLPSTLYCGGHRCKSRIDGRNRDDAMTRAEAEGWSKGPADAADPQAPRGMRCPKCRDTKAGS